MDIKKIAGGSAVTVLLGLFSYYYNAHGKCMEEANSAITEYQNLRIELGKRILFLAEAVDQSHNSLREFGKQIAPVRSFLSTYKDKNTSELLHMENALEFKFYPFSSIQLQMSQTLDNKSRHILDSLLFGTVPPNVSDNDFQYIQDIILKFNDALAAQGSVTLLARCDIAQTVPIIFGYKPEIVDKLPASSSNP
jgi:hypothetical protein